MAWRVGMSQSMVSRIWRAFGLQPHKADTFKLSTNPAFDDAVAHAMDEAPFLAALGNLEIPRSVRGGVVIC